MPKQQENKKAGNTEATTSSKAEEKKLDNRIRLRVVNESSSEVFFEVKLSVPLIRLKQAYCKTLGLQIEDLRFMFDGHRITDDDSPHSLDMNNEDVIEVYELRIGGFQLYNIEPKCIY